MELNDNDWLLIHDSLCETISSLKDKADIYKEYRQEKDFLQEIAEYEQLFAKIDAYVEKL
jgi:hypothetical protein